MKAFLQELEKAEKAFFRELEEAGHVLRRDENGKVDEFAMAYEFHNGPICVKCGDYWCTHCAHSITACSEKDK